MNCDYCNAPDADEVVWTVEESVYVAHLCEKCDQEEIKALEEGDE